MMVAPWARKISSKSATNGLAPSRMRNRTDRSEPMNRVRAGWVVHAPVGFAVIPARWTRRVSTSMKNNTYRWRHNTVFTQKKSHATIPAAWLGRNVVQDSPTGLVPVDAGLLEDCPHRRRGD